MLATMLMRRLRPLIATPAADAAASGRATQVDLWPVQVAKRLLTSGTAVKQPIALAEDDLEESFVKGSGKGGQKINKVRNCVLLKHKPTGLLVRCQKTRSLDDNRRVARKLLIQKLDDHFNGKMSARSLKFEKLRRKKANKSHKAKKKYAARAEETGDDEEQDGDDEDSSDEEDADYEDDDEEEEEEEEEEDNAATKSKTKK